MRADGGAEMFDGVAPRYDLLNRLTSLGLDRLWRRQLLRALPQPPAGRWLDLACGTGDVMVALARSGRAVIGLDPSLGMMEVARGKLDAPLIQGDARRLPFPDACFDGITMAFGIRNVPQRAEALAEARRVLRFGGCLAILELGQPPSGLLGAPQRLYLRQILPRLGAALALNPAAYDYLAASVEGFDPHALSEDVAAAGFEGVTLTALGFGVVYLLVGRRREGPACLLRARAAQ